MDKEFVAGDGRKLTSADIVRLYRESVNLSIPTGGKIQRINDDTYSLTNKFSAVDCDVLESIKTTKNYSLTTKGNCIESVVCISDAHVTAELASATSENGRFRARLTEKEGPKRQRLEIWDRAKHLKTIDTSELESHGSIVLNNPFFSFHWSPFGEQDKLLYVCQRKQPKELTLFDGFKSTGGEKDSTSKDTAFTKDKNLGEKFLKRPDWGETLVGIEHTILAVLDVANNFHITTIDLEDFSLGDAQWLDDGSKLVSVAYRESPRRLGLVHCNSRPRKIVVHDWRSQEVVIELSDNRLSYGSPRVNNAGDKFIYLGNPTHGAHLHAAQVFIYDMKSAVTKALSDSSSGKNEVFVERLTLNCFSSDDKHLLLTTSGPIRTQMSLYSIETGKFKQIEFPTNGVTILDYRYDIILASGSEINATPTLFVAVFNSANIHDVIAWHQIEDCVHLHELDSIQRDVKVGEKQDDTISTLLTTPNLNVIQQNFPGRQSPETKLITHAHQLPTVVILHGGPHSAFSIYYIPTLVFYSRLGLQTLLINYRGSSGVSEDYLSQLCGQVGTMDVGDCLTAVRDYVSNRLIDPKNLIVSGGSHGGFLSCHMSCQDEFKFTSAIIRNPVVDIASLHQTSDIPDWAYTEALGHETYDPAWIPDEKELTKMYKCSPFSKVHQANVPTLMLLGSEDLRVNMYQGQRWVDVLHARGVATLCKVYPDNHALAKPDVAADSTVTAATWMLSHLPKL